MTSPAPRARLATALAVAPIVATLVLGGFVTVPFAAMGPGPTVNVLGTDPDNPDGKKEVIEIAGTEVHSAKGHLNMTTVAVHDHLSVIVAVALWLSNQHGLVPRAEVYPPDQTTDDVHKQNADEFSSSEDTAQAAALKYLGHPTRVGVGSVGDKSPSHGLLRVDDQVLRLNGEAVSDAADFRKRISGIAPDKRVTIDVRRGDAEQSVEIKLGHRPDDKGKGFLGVGIADVPDVPFTVKFNLEDIGGPSAGLMFSLGIIDKLTPGDLTAGKFIAGTGTIDSDGEVGPIGGIPFKMVAAKDAGAEAFLVPADNCKEASANAPDDLRLIKVDTLEHAVTAVEDFAKGDSTPSC